MRATIFRLMLSLAVVSVSAISAAPAAAQGDDSLRQAKEYFDKAKGLFQSGSYKEAAELFDKAYKARPFPQFLFNIGACHEK